MRRRSLAVTAALICTIMLVGGLEARTVRAAPAANTAAADGDLFGLSKVVGIHIEIAVDEYQAMQPPAPAGGFGGPTRGRKRPAPGRARGTSLGLSSPGCAGH